MGSAEKNEGRARGLGRASLNLCFLIFAVFVANVLLGKARLAFGWAPIPLFGDLGEYLLLMGTALSFAIAALLREQVAIQEKDKNSGN